MSNWYAYQGALGEVTHDGRYLLRPQGRFPDRNIQHARGRLGVLGWGVERKAKDKVRDEEKASLPWSNTD